MRVKFKIWFLPIASMVAVVGSLGSIQIGKGGSLWWWIPVVLFIGVVTFCIIQMVLWFIWERKS